MKSHSTSPMPNGGAVVDGANTTSRHSCGDHALVRVCSIKSTAVTPAVCLRSRLRRLPLSPGGQARPRGFPCAPTAYASDSDSIVPLSFLISTAGAVPTSRLSLQSLVFNRTATAFAVATNCIACQHHTLILPSRFRNRLHYNWFPNRIGFGKVARGSLAPSGSRLPVDCRCASCPDGDLTRPGRQTSRNVPGPLTCHACPACLAGRRGCYEVFRFGTTELSAAETSAAPHLGNSAEPVWASLA